MRIKTLLNKCYKFKSFVYKTVRWHDDKNKRYLEVTVAPRKNSQAICSSCHCRATCYDHQNVRRFEFVPLWGYPVYLVYRMRRVQCSNCGIKIEEVPWAKGKQTITIAFIQFLAGWAKRLSWQETAICFKTSWQKVYSSVRYVVDWGLAHRDLSKVESIGIDEVSWKKGHQYLTLVYQIDAHCTRLLWIGKDRTIKTLLRFFRMLGKERSSMLKHVCSDMWRPYLKVIKKKASQAIHVLDRFHLVSMLNKAVDEVRAGEYRQMKEDGHEPILKQSRWCLLKRKENLTEKQEVKLKDLLKYNLKSVRAYLLKEDFDGFWKYVSPAWAEKYLKRWCTRVMRSKIEPMKKVAKTFRRHTQLILNWFIAKKAFSSGIVEGLNNKVKVTTRKSYGFRTYDCIEIALYHVLGNLPDPPSTHRF